MPDLTEYMSLETKPQINLDYVFCIPSKKSH